MTAWTLFLHPMRLGSQYVLYLILPLCVSVAVVYKTVRTKNLRRLWLETLVLIGYMVLGLVALAVGLFVLLEYGI